MPPIIADAAIDGATKEIKTKWIDAFNKIPDAASKEVSAKILSDRFKTEIQSKLDDFKTSKYMV